MFATAALLFHLTLAPDLPEAQARAKALELYRSGQSHMTNERYEEAAADFKQAVGLDPMLVLAHYNLGQCHMVRKEYVQAASAYQAAKDAILRTSSLSDRERAERERAARDERNDLRMAIQAIASGHIKAAQPQQQITRMEDRIRVLESMEMRGRDEVVRVPAEIELALGSAWFRQQKLAEAERAYSAAVKADGRLGAAHNNLAVIYMLTGRYKDAHASIAAAEAAGFLVPARFKADLQQRESVAGEK
jgi:tetratricopeptide (TPR) repeat protein